MRRKLAIHRKTYKVVDITNGRNPYSTEFEAYLNITKPTVPEINIDAPGEVVTTDPVNTTTDLYVRPISSWLNYQNSNLVPQVERDLIKTHIESQPIGEWLGEWSGNVFDFVTDYFTRTKGKTPTFILYNIPGRDNGNYSAGGLPNPEAYYSWVGSIGAAIGNNKAILVLEPDAVGLSRDLTPQKKAERLEMIRVAVDILRKQPNVTIYIDASMWVSTDELKSLLTLAGIEKADGFSVNVSGYVHLDKCKIFGEELSTKLGGKKYIIDTSRNGNGESTEQPDPWCNPTGRALGVKPTTKTHSPKCAAYLWLKVAGESDGECRGGIPAGQWYHARAIEMINNSL